MKLERLHEYVTATVATIAGMTLAVMCGSLTGRGQTGVLFTILLTLAIGAVVLGLKQRIWMLIPICWSLTGQIRELPVPFAVRDLLIITVFFISLIFIALKIVRGKAHYTPTDLVFFGMLIYLLTTFLRNPVGVDALNSTRVGGRPYFDVFIATLSFWIISRVHVSDRESRTFPFLMAGGGMINGLISGIAFVFPFTVPWMVRFYSGVAVETLNAAELNRLNSTTPVRHGYLGGLGINPLAVLFAFWRPARALNPLEWRLFLPAVLAGIAVLASGFRSLVLMTVVYFCISSYFRTGWRDIIRLGLLAIPALALLIAGQGRLYNLPHNVQRSLSFLPGAWDYAATSDAKHSSDWRFFMWKVVLTEDKYIENKWLGDGFGFSKREWEQIKRTEAQGAVGDQESVMIVGGVHSGPISAIRCVGILGLLLYTAMLIMMARYAWRLIISAKGTAFFPLAIYLGSPRIYEPLNYWFIFGGFDSGFPQSIFYLGLLNMLRNSLDRAVKIAPVEKAVPEQTIKRKRQPLMIGDDGMPAGLGPGPVWQPRPR